ncbi:MAG: hypothetical protein JWR62_1185 [Modestobacter sp.]|jgi:hypothetical protein|nr:hypothetical protein [Modestobacter sp.]
MTADRPTTRPAGSRSNQDDLLDDLLATVPVTAPTRTVPVPATPVVEVRLTPLRWSMPRGLPVADPTGVLLSFGPLQLFVGRHAG